MTTPLPEQPPTSAAGQRPPAVPAHHRPPNIVYDEYGRPVHFTVGQPIVPLPTVQAPVRQGLSPDLQRLIIVTFLILAVVVVCVGALCALVVLMGGTLIGIIGTVQQNAEKMALLFIGSIVALGWAASKIQGFRRGKEQ